MASEYRQDHCGRSFSLAYDWCPHCGRYVGERDSSYFIEVMQDLIPFFVALATGMLGLIIVLDLLTHVLHGHFHHPAAIGAGLLLAVSVKIWGWLS